VTIKTGRSVEELREKAGEFSSALSSSSNNDGAAKKQKF